MTWVWRGGQPLLDRRATPRAEYRRTAPALLELEGHRCAVRDLGVGGLRVEPAPAGRVWERDQPVIGTLYLRTAGQMTIHGRIGRIDRAGLAILPADSWPNVGTVEVERAALMRNKHERRLAPRLPLPQLGPTAGGLRTPLLDVSATGIRYALSPTEAIPPPGSRIEGELRLDAEAVIEVRGRVVRNSDREVAVCLDYPGLTPEVMALLRQRFFQPAEREPSG